jgi:hypothetical protein
MSYELLITGEAREDMAAGYQHYESELSGLGERFLSSVLQRFVNLEIHPEYYSFIASPEEGLRDVAVPGFPYVVVYEIIGHQVVIYAVHATEKRPRDKYKS